jgi:predicted aspartyl protease
MIRGEFIKENVPIVKAMVAWKQATQETFFLLDTGFTGDMQVTPGMAKELGLEVTGAINTKIANGEIVAIPTASALSLMEGITKNIQVLISKGVPLLGISFLAKFDYKAIVDCKYKTVALERVS